MKKNYQQNQNACVQKRPNTQQKRPVYTAKEACIHSKRGLYTQQKRPVYTAEEAYINEMKTRAF